LIDAMIRDGLWDVYKNIHMGLCGDQCAAKYQFTRQMQDDFAAASFKRALAAMSAGVFADEIVPVEAPAGKAKVSVAEDENPRKFNEEKMRQLRPAFGKEGTVTAGNASSINDGAAAFVVMSAEKGKALGVKPQARIVGYATASREPEWFPIAPVDAIRKVLDQCSMQPSDIDLWEINEAFSVVPMVAMREFGIERCRINVYGGAAALGHPIGASGARTLATLLNAMKRREAKIGLDVLCIGGGEAIAMIVERV
jgi:acetyl-CoA C-acetyltransferase